MADGKTRSIGCQGLLVGRIRSYRVQTSTMPLNKAAVGWRGSPKDTVLLISVHQTLRQLLQPFRAAAWTKHPRSLLTQANIFAGKEQRCTHKVWECLQPRSNPTNQNSANTTASCLPFSKPGVSSSKFLTSNSLLWPPSPTPFLLFPSSEWSANQEVSQSATFLTMRPRL